MAIQALAARSVGGKLEPFSYDPGPLGPEHIEIKVEYCGICHSDLSMLNNDWGMTAFPFVPGHEVAGRIVAAGPAVKGLTVGQRVGLGWFTQSCMHCSQCMSGDHNLCQTAEQTIVRRHGGFADRVRCHWAWATALPDEIDHVSAGPLFCGGVTVFNPIVQCEVRPTQRVGVVGIGGLGHLALQFLNKWGCQVVAFTSSDGKREEALSLGAHETVNSRSDGALAKIKGSLDFLLVTVNVPLNWQAYVETLAPRGRLHFVGAVPEPISLPAFSLIFAQRAISGSPLGSPATTRAMIDFCARHSIKPIIEEFPMSKANEAMERLESGKARYRIVLKNDLG